MARTRVLVGDCTELISKQSLAKAKLTDSVGLTFLDPPFNQGKEYGLHNDSQPADDYWNWMKRICDRAISVSADGGSLFFMQREKNAEHVLRCLRETGWSLQNLIIWKKLTSAVPGRYRFGLQHQVIAFGTKGKRPRTFHRLRIDAPLRPGYRQPRVNGVFVTDCWDDIRELTAGYFAGDEALRTGQGDRFHKQQSPLALLVRIILSATNPGDIVLDPFAGTGTTLVAAKQLGRDSVGIEIDPENANVIRQRVGNIRKGDDISSLRHYYRFSPSLGSTWPGLDDHVAGDKTQLELLKT